MKNFRARIRRAFYPFALAVTAAAAGGCVFDPVLEFFVDDFSGSVFVSVSLRSTLRECSRNNDRVSCTFSPSPAPDIESRVSLEGAGGAGLRFVDPLVLLLPDAARSLRGSYSAVDATRNSRSGGDLVVRGGLSSLRVDKDRSLNAPASTQLVVIELPEGVAGAGGHAFNFSFEMPAGTTVIPFRALFTGRVSIDGETFYPPLLPCITDLSAAPSYLVPTSDPGRLNLLSAQNSGCNDVRYLYDGGGGLPTLIFGDQFEP